jgi:hypothetical protein
VKLDTIRPQFAEFIPRELDEGVLYISEEHNIAVHKCASGCGEKVVTPLSPAEWQLRKEGDLVSLYPSIGNWNYACRSHYWIRRNRIVWAGSLSEREIARLQARDRADKERYIEATNRRKSEVARDVSEAGSAGLRESWSARLLAFLRSFWS